MTSRMAHLVTALCAALLPLFVGCSREAAAVDTQAPRPNVIFILIDTLRADRLGAYGPQRQLSPTLDEIAREGVLFERATATAPWTLASVASLFSGCYPTVHKATDYRSVAGPRDQNAGKVKAFSKQFTTLAEAFQEAGYQTAAVSANPFIIPRHGFGQGFDSFDALAGATHAPGDEVNRSALEWLARREHQRPFLLYLHYMDPHAPYRAAPEFLDPLIDKVRRTPNRRPLTNEERTAYRSYFVKSSIEFGDNQVHRRLRRTVEYWNARYDAGVMQVDAHIAALRDELRRQGLWDDALLIVTADHGEALGEHGTWGHGTTAYQDQLHVPLMLRWKGQLPPGQRIATGVRHFDVYPTLFDYLGMSAPADIQAVSLRGVIEGREGADRLAFAEAVNTQPFLKAMVQGDWKLLYQADQRTGQLFNLKNDPGELQDCRTEHAAQLARLTREIQAQMAANEKRAEGVQETDAAVSEEDARRLEALGYLGSSSDEDAEAGDADEGDEEP